MINSGDYTRPASMARRALLRHEMTDYAGSIAWLLDPATIPRAVVDYGKPSHPNPYDSLGEWMLCRLVDWSGRVHNRLPYAETFARHELDNFDRVDTRRMISDQVRTAFAPGMAAMVEIQEVVPKIAARDGVDRAQWPAIALAASQLGAQLAVDGTHIQALIRGYLDVKPGESVTEFDPAKLRLDQETGITTVTPIDRLIKATKVAIERHPPEHGTNNICVALQAPIPELGGMTMFDATWRAYAAAAATHIYPQQTIDPTTVPPQLPPDADIDISMNVLAAYNYTTPTYF